jgi:cyclopropane fatty-acyl-phospholipid synthase-like methyltransferase
VTRLRGLVGILAAPRARARLQALRDAQALLRLAVGSAALRTGVLPALAAGPCRETELAGSTRATDVDLLRPWLRVLESRRYVRQERGAWALAPAGRALLEDDVLRAVHEAFPGYHSALYRDLPSLLAGGPSRDDVGRYAEVIARVSEAQQPVVSELLRGVAAEERPARVLDIGTGTGHNLVSLLTAAPAATGVGVEMDPEVARAARGRLAADGLAERAIIVEGELRELVGSGELDGGFDVAVLANAVYYVPFDERTALFRDVAALLTDRGVLVLVTTAAGKDLFSRHFDLELRAHRRGMELPDLDELGEQLRDSGLRPQPPRTLLPGQPLVAVLARR